MNDARREAHEQGRDGQFGARASTYEERGAGATRGPRVVPTGNTGRGGVQQPTAAKDSEPPQS